MLAIQLGEQSSKLFMMLHGCFSPSQSGREPVTTPAVRGRMVAMATISCLTCMLESSRLRIKVGFLEIGNL